MTCKGIKKKEGRRKEGIGRKQRRGRREEGGRDKGERKGAKEGERQTSTGNQKLRVWFSGKHHRKLHKGSSFSFYINTGRSSLSRHLGGLYDTNTHTTERIQADN